MVKVAICYTKDNKSGNGICDAFARGVAANGDTPVRIKNLVELDSMEGCDVSFQVCEHPDFAWLKADGFRASSQKKSKELGIPRIVADAGFVKHERANYKKKFGIGTHYSVGLNGVKNHAEFFNQNSPSKRWKKLKIEMMPWQTNDEGHILVLGQNNKGIGTTNIRKINPDPEKWFRHEIEKLKSFGKPIVFRPHPTEKHRRFIDDKSGMGVNISQYSNLENDLKDCFAVFSPTSNAAVDAIIRGVPVITNDSLSIVREVASPSIEDIRRPDRTQWAYNLAYAQWNISEMNIGVCWKHIKQNL
jgi:hypothetical protein